MTITPTPARTNIGTRHPDLYATVGSMAQMSEQAALGEGISPLLIELIKIRVSQINGCAYCLRIHTADSQAKGETPERLSVLSAWKETKYFDGRERAALALAEYVTLIKDSHSNRGLYESAAGQLTAGQVSAVIWVAMAINAFNRIAISSSYKVAPAK
ncbi:carboxymuconolactone decarboxylase family protein [Arthrobacter sp. ISL-28]|uniref:carboxymuconolactone decarboxylase family protein n=1 Tax=Arthrobacter sp. ISL-28 TaxID=2819108 RepID=UPI001BEA3540|nr:carboxymuconolactone decarboxylase family protein [Arthrobacter sp. ISL-28]MBT2522514.1 carboxymuconolactone decarboxylase family protein [Arthrobacter sp. ISL-28]